VSTQPFNFFTILCAPIRQKKLVAKENHSRFRSNEDNRTRCQDRGPQHNFKKLEIKMNAPAQLEILSNRIADAIVDFVNDTNGPVTFSQVDLEVPEFTSEERSTWDYLIENSGKEFLIWSGMSEAGYKALSKIISGRRVAIQFVNVLPYILDNCLLNDNDWLPSVLVPAKAANLETPRRLLRTSEHCRKYLMERAAAEKKTGYRPLSPRSMQFSADAFCLGGWQD
jgi:hypothetical protein